MMIDVQIRGLRLEAQDILSLELVASKGGPLPAFSAGAHIDVHLPNGLVRQYSLYNDPAQNHRYQIAVLLAPDSRGGSRAVHEALRIGQQLRISTPRNLFALQEHAPHSLLFAGGIGITPLLAMAQRLHSLGADFALHYCTRTQSRAAFIEALLTAPFADKVHLHCDDDPTQRLNLNQVLDQHPASSQLYVCGPNGFMEHVFDSARTKGWPEAQLHREYFAPPQSTHDTASTFSLRIASTGLVLPVPAERSALDVLEEAGYAIPMACGQGICGTCVTRVLEGEPEHRDMFLSEEEQARNDCFTPCCSRSRSACLVVDL